MHSYWTEYQRCIWQRFLSSATRESGLRLDIVIHDHSQKFEMSRLANFTCTIKIYFKRRAVYRMLSSSKWRMTITDLMLHHWEKCEAFTVTRTRHARLRFLRFSVNASYFSQRRKIRSLIVVRHFEGDNILYTIQCLKYIFIVHMKFAKRNISKFWSWLTMSILSQGPFYSLETNYDPSSCSVLNLTLSPGKNSRNRDFKTNFHNVLLLTCVFPY